MSSPETERPQGPRRFIRTRRGRLVGGVCSGLGVQFGVDPLLFRIAFVGLTLFAGAGLWLYLAILLLAPEEGASRAPIRLGRSSWPVIAGVAALIAAAAILLPTVSHAALGSAWGVGEGVGWIVLVGALATLIWLRLRRARELTSNSADRRLARALALGTAIAAAATLLAVAGAALAGTHRHAAAWAVLAFGSALALSAFSRLRWLLLPAALAFAVPVAVFAAGNVDLHGGVGERDYRPRALRELRSGYRLGAGRLEVDLRKVAFPPGDTLLRVRVGVGELVVVVPDEVCVATRARVGGGFVGALDRQADGLDLDWTERPSAPAGVPRLVLDGRVGLGALFVVDRPLTGAFHTGAYGSNHACDARTRGLR